MLRMTTTVFTLGWMALGQLPEAAMAQENPDAVNQATRLKEVTVTSTRTARKTDNVPNTVTVTTQEEIEQSGARDIKDLLRNEVDVSVTHAPTRFTAAGPATGRAGVEGINIRGLEGNQVLMLVDGIRVPNSFSFSSFSTGRGDFIEVNGLKSVEVLRGPTSTQFGSDGLAGAVSFRTLDPGDLLQGERSFGGFARSAYTGLDQSWTQALGVAGKNERWQGMLLGSYRQGHEVGNKGSNDAQNLDRTTPNPVDYNGGYLLGKALLHINPAHQLGVTLELQDRAQDTEVYSARATAPLSSRSTLGLNTRDQMERNRVSLEHKYSDLNGPWVQRIETRLYRQDAKINQFSNEKRNTAPARTRDNTYRSDVVGVSSLLESNFSLGLSQRLSYGFDWSRSDTSGVRDGTVPPAGESFPTKPFPDTRYTLAGLFVQSEMELGSLSIIPGLRFDHYALTPSGAGYSGGPTSNLSDQALTPRFGVVWRLDPALAPYAQWAKGFRAPTPDQVNNGFSNLASGYTTVGNPNLKAERANSIEIGVRGKLADWRYSLAAFDNRYDNFISQQVVGGAGTPANPTVFQYINLSKAHIQGLELRTEWAASSKLSMQAGLAYAKGDSESKGVSSPLDTVNPIKMVLGVRYNEAQWGARADVAHSQGKSARRIAAVSPAQFASPAYTVLDLGLHWKPLRQLNLNANINNVFDTKYWRWSDVRGLAYNSPIQDAYSAPGRSFQLSARYDF